MDVASSDFHLNANSPCIDAGDPTGGQDPDGTLIDVGAFFFDQNQTGGFQLSANPDPIVAGQFVTLSVANATPNRPTQLAGPTTADANGQVIWALPVPQQAAGLSIWMQAAQFGQVSNVLASLIQ